MEMNIEILKRSQINDFECCDWILLLSGIYRYFEEKEKFDLISEDKFEMLDKKVCV